MKKAFVLVICLCVLLTATAAFASDAAPYSVTYEPNNCLAAVPTDENTYAAGQLVNVLFDPVAYKDYLIFYGWDMNNDGVADFGYNYNTFTMPEGNVTLKAICIPAWGGGSSCNSCCGGCCGCGCGRSCGVNDRDFYGGNIVYRNFPNRNVWPYVW